MRAIILARLSGLPLVSRSVNAACRAWQTPLNAASNMYVRFLLVGATAVFLSACASTQPRKGIHTSLGSRSGQKMTVRTTAYTHTEAGGIKNGIGGRLRFKSEFRSAA